MKQHRHVYPGLNNDEVCGWHDASRVHVKYPTAHDVIYEEREVEDKPGAKKGKVKAPQYSFNEYGEAVIPPPPPSEGELFALAVAEAEAEVAEVLAAKPAKAK